MTTIESVASPLAELKFKVISPSGVGVNDILTRCGIDSRLYSCGEYRLIDLKKEFNGEFNTIDLKGAINLGSLCVAQFRFGNINLFIGRLEDRNAALGTKLVKDQDRYLIDLKVVQGKYPNFKRFVLMCRNIEYVINEDLLRRHIIKSVTGNYLLICDAPTWTIYGGVQGIKLMQREVLVDIG